MLIVNPKSGFTMDEITQVVLVKVTRKNAGAVICLDCGSPLLRFSHDSGMDALKWCAAANAIKRLWHDRQRIGA